MPPINPQKFFDLADIGADARRGEAARGAGLGGLDYLQLGLAGVGFTPGPVGIGADLLDAGISALRGDWLGMGLGLGAAVPGLGMGMSGRHAGKLLGQGAQSMDEVMAARRALGLPEELPLSFGGMNPDDALRAFNRMSPQERLRYLTPEHKLGVDLIGDPSQMRPNRQVGYPPSPGDRLLREIEDPIRLRGAVTEEEKVAALQEYLEEAAGEMAHSSMLATRSAVELDTPGGVIRVSDEQFDKLLEWRYSTKKDPGDFLLGITGEAPKVVRDNPAISRYTQRTGYGTTPEKQFTGQKGRVKSEHAADVKEQQLVDELAGGSEAARRELSETRGGRSRLQDEQQQRMVEGGMVDPSRAGQEGFQVRQFGEEGYDPVIDRFVIPDEGVRPVLVRGEEEITGRVASKMGRSLKTGKPKRIATGTRQLTTGKQAMTRETPVDVMHGEVKDPRGHLPEHEQAGGRKLAEQRVDPQIPESQYVEAIEEAIERESREEIADLTEFGGSTGRGDAIRLKTEDGREMIAEVFDSSSKQGNTTLRLQRVLDYNDYIDVVEHGALSGVGGARMFMFERAFKNVRGELRKWGTLQRTTSKIADSYLLPPPVVKMFRRQAERIGDANIHTLFEELDYKTLDAIQESIINSERAIFKVADKDIKAAEELLEVRGLINNFSLTPDEFKSFVKTGKLAGEMQKKVDMAKKTLGALAPHMARKEIIFDAIGRFEPQTARLWGKEVSARAGSGVDVNLRDAMTKAIEGVVTAERALDPSVIDARLYEILTNNGVSKADMETAIPISKQVIAELTGNPALIQGAISRKVKLFSDAIDGNLIQGVAGVYPTRAPVAGVKPISVKGKVLKPKPSKKRTLPKKK